MGRAYRGAGKMKGNSIKVNYIYNTMYQVLNLILPFVTTPYISRVIGAEGIGTYSYVYSWASYFVLFATFGTKTFGRRQISYEQEDKIRRSKTFWEIEIFSVLSSGICLFLYLIFIIGKDNQLIYFIQAIYILNVACDITWFFQGMENFKSIILRNIAFKVLNIIYLFMFVKAETDLPVYVFGLCIFTLFGNLALWLEIHKYIVKISIREINIKKHIKGSAILFIPTIAIQVYTVLDKTMIGLIAEEFAENGYYELAQRMYGMALTIVTSLGTVMIPRIGHVYEKRDFVALKSYMYHSYNYIWFISIPMTFGLIGIAGRFVPWFFGKGYEPVVPILTVLSILIIIIGLSNMTGNQYLVPTQKQKIFTVSVFAGAAINFFFNLMLIPRYLALGAAVASVIAETVVTIIQFYKVRKELDISIIFKNSINYFFSGVVMFAIIKIVDSFVGFNNLFTVLCMVFCGAFSYILILICIRDKFTKEIICSFLKNIK